ncbi:protochlorophyllide oxidoreductase [Chlorobium sp. BLA1]|uniref:flavodoxin domain-containing protein n=1 Tax=Candidatus Chlorobium masyuteum TaxID=2716876 RepID=UPI0014204864|nr:flavodoxin domain-containing protein [Candidatus Chlorobium masyuteum]NHQ59775.1 protochlorophyllide oxidoreductase [Candidatus Chlorobium masyuteum]NTU44944.1 protochlorophyllide oxidoreductase [Chlorobiaceae bacterium]
MRAVILYDSKTAGGSTEAIIDSIGQQLAESGAYVEKAKCKAMADYSFVREFDIVILGAPVYYFLVSSQLLAALIQGNLKKNLRRKKIALFLTCGSPDTLAAVLYLPQLKIHLVRNRILAEKIIPPGALSESETIEEFVDDLLYEYEKTLKEGRASHPVEWSDDALGLLHSIPSFMQGKIKAVAEEYAAETGCREITVAVLMAAKDEMQG